MDDGEAQYQPEIERIRREGHEALGLMTSWAWRDDPKRLVFTLARYKFVAKMFEGVENALEVGCGDGFASRIVAQSVGALTAIDFDQSFIDDASARPSSLWPIDFRRHNLMEAPLHIDRRRFDGAYSLDVLEHIPREEEDQFLGNLRACLTPHARCVIGMPSLESQLYASPQSKKGHVNCKTQAELKEVMSRYFQHVFMFGLNDETLHTGYAKMAHYNIALCASPTK
jgi:2-polyprenyl-3-methyl-5-hydroxy-6-metoxy-1,4-benzoquinol methylase